MKNKLSPQKCSLLLLQGLNFGLKRKLRTPAEELRLTFDMSWSLEDILGVISMEIDLDKVFNIDRH